MASDFNGDGYADLATSADNREGTTAGPKPVNEDGVGSVQIDYGSASGIVPSESQFFDQLSPGVPTDPDSENNFGSSMASGYFNGDCYADLAISAPGNNNFDGAVVILYGSATGLHANNNAVLPVAGSGGQFGTALAAGDFNHNGFDDLAIGAYTAGTGPEASGAVDIVPGSVSGLATSGTWLNQDSPGVPGTSEGGDFWGTVLAAGDFNGDGTTDLAIGAPGETDGSVVESGAVTMLLGSSTGLTATGSKIITQATAGVPGSNEKGDEFGSDLAAGDINGDGKADLVVGIPSEGIGSLKLAGDIAYLPGSSTGITGTGAKRYSQATAGIPGTAAAGDQVGSEVVVADFNGDGRDDIAFGAVFDKVGSPSIDGGSVTIMNGTASGPSTTGVKLISQATSGVPGSPQGGAAFSVGLHAAALHGGAQDDLAVGARSYLVGQNEEEGYAVVLRGIHGTGVTGTGAVQIAETPKGPAPKEFDAFGSSFG